MIQGPDSARPLAVAPLPTPTRDAAVAPTTVKAPETSDAFAGSPQAVVVRRGDTLGSLAARYNIPMSQLKELNPNLFTDGRDAQGNKRAANGHWIYPGDRVRLRPEGVQAGGYGADAMASKLQAAMEALSATGQLDPNALSNLDPQAQAKAVDSAPPQTEVKAPNPEYQGLIAQFTADVAPKTETVTTAPVQLPSAAGSATAPVQLPPAPSVAEQKATPTAVGGQAPVVPVKLPEPEQTGKKAKVYGVERWDPSQKPTSPPPIPMQMASGEPMGKDAQLLIGALLIGMSFTDMSLEAQQNVGDAAVGEILGQYPLYTENPEVVRYVSSVGAKMVNQSARADIDWHFYVVKSDDINAFALPGGHVFITTGALQNLKSEDELAAVLGHEIAHVEKGHGAKKLQRGLMSQGIAIAALGDHGANAQLAGQLAVSIALKGYDRDAEDEADSRGVELANRAGYDPHGLIGFFNTLQAKNPHSGGVPTWASDHPPTEDRIQRITAKIGHDGLKAGGPVSQDRFHKVIASI